MLHTKTIIGQLQRSAWPAELCSRGGMLSAGAAGQLSFLGFELLLDLASCRCLLAQLQAGGCPWGDASAGAPAVPVLRRAHVTSVSLLAGVATTAPTRRPLGRVLCILPGKVVVQTAGSHGSELAGAARWAGRAASLYFLHDLGIFAWGEACALDVRGVVRQLLCSLESP